MFEKIILENGVRLLLEEMPGMHSATVGIWIDSSRQISEDLPAGLPHFAEHMLFKGTHSRDSQSLIRSIEDTGGMVNAMTDKESTCFYARVLSGQLVTALDVLGEMLTSPSFDEGEMERERQVILQEILMNQDSPTEKTLESFVRQVWAESPFGDPVIGTEASVKSFDRSVLLKYFKENYRPGNVIISVAGGFEKKEVVAQVKHIFGAWSASDMQSPETLPPRYSPAQRCEEKALEQVSFCIGGEGITAGSDDRFALTLIDTVLGAGMGSRLFQELREKRGLVYGIHTFEILYRYGGLFGIHGQVKPENLNAVAEQVLLILEDLRQKGLSGDELKRAQEKIKGHLLLNLESTRYRSMRNARSEMYLNTHLTPEAVCAKIDAVTGGEILEITRRLFAPESLSYYVLGPVPLTFPSFAK